MPTIAVTGGSGGAGAFVIRHLLEHGYECRNLDRAPPAKPLCPFHEIDMTDYARVHEALAGCDMLVHFAGEPHPDDDHWGAAQRFANNTDALFNAFNAARAHDIKRVVWASSETVYGFPFENCRPAKIPASETAPRQPQNGYALSKAVSEDLATMMATLYDMVFVGLRLSNVLYDDETVEPSYQKIPGYWDDLAHRKFNLWGYVDARDVGEAVRLSLIADLTGAEVFNIAAADTIMRQSNRELIDAVFPGVEIDPAHGDRQAMLDITKAERMLGFSPQYSWSTVLGLDP